MKKIITSCLILMSLACFNSPDTYWNIQVLSPGDLRESYYHIYGVTIEETEEQIIIYGYKNFRSNDEGTFELYNPVIIKIPMNWTYQIIEYQR